MDVVDGFDAEEAIFDEGEELGVSGFVGAGGVERDGCEVAGGYAGDGSTGCFGVGCEGGGADECGVDDVAVRGEVAVAEELEEIGVLHG